MRYSFVSFVGREGLVLGGERGTGGPWASCFPFKFLNLKLSESLFPPPNFPFLLFPLLAADTSVTARAGGVKRIEDVAKVGRKTWQFLFFLNSVFPYLVFFSKLSQWECGDKMRAVSSQTLET